MNARSPSVGRHAIGSPIARSGTKPPKRTGSPSGGGFGTGVNKKTGAKPEYNASKAKLNDNGQIDQWVDQAPEPFRNSQPSANPRNFQSSPKNDFGYSQFESTSGLRTGGSGGYGSQPRANMSAASAGGGLGQEKGKVIGKSQPRRAGNPKNQPQAKFYGR